METKALVKSLMVSYFVVSFYPRDGLDEIWDPFESDPEYFLPTLSCLTKCSAIT